MPYFAKSPLAVMTAACLPALLLPMVNAQAQNPDEDVLDAIVAARIACPI